MSSIIRWRKGEILRAVGMGDPRGVVLLMASNDTGNPRRGKSRPTPTQRRRAQNARSPTLPRSGLVQWWITGWLGKWITLHHKPTGRRIESPFAYHSEHGLHS